ncbi:MAG: PQQ-like beta-propeller repeat protein [Rhodospirillaceae bacterium]|nr:PQQ-like beta-propeller repeat protein [Rhodospirillaceae bacterium]
MAIAVHSCDPLGERCTWQRTHGGAGIDKAFAVATLDDGSVVAVGTTRRPDGGRDDALVLRIDADGNAVWRRVFGGSDTDQALGATPAADGGVLVVGHTRSEGAGQSDLWAERLDAAGNTLWRLVDGGPGNDRAEAVAATADGGFVIAGFTTSVPGHGRDAWVVRLDDTGTIVWQRSFGGTGTDGAAAVAETVNGDILLTGHRFDAATGFDLWVARLDRTGRTVWEHCADRTVLDAGTAIVELAGGTIAVLGATQPGPGLALDALVVTLDGDGTPRWQRTLDGGGDDMGYAIAEAGGGGLVVLAATNGRGAGSSDVWLMGLDAGDGGLRWERTYGGAFWDRPAGLAVGADGRLMVAGYTTSAGAGYEDWLLLRLDADGRL